ncbi:MAG TPA: YIP1 family protein [Longimicrobiales bacterium]|nr:YIP1 family protein [Longimicrobiales bacterium]
MQRSMIDRMKGAALLDVATYEEVEHDPQATMQAAGVVALVAVASAIGSWQLGPISVAWAAVSALLSWGLWAAVTYIVGDKLFGGTATWGELLRTLGFAQAPGVLGILVIIPFLGWMVAIVMFFWMLATGIVAIRQALDFGTGKAVLTAVIGLVCVVALRMLMALLGIA